MDAYAVSARIGRATPQLVIDSVRGCAELTALPAAEFEAVVMLPDGRPIDPDPTLAERWDAIRERWSQLTFYVTDANSWR